MNAGPVNPAPPAPALANNLIKFESEKVKNGRFSTGDFDGESEWHRQRV